VTWTWGAVCRAKQNQLVSGDVYVVIEQAEGQLLAAVVDGLGGGEEAAHAARGAEQVIREHAEWPLQDLVQRSHIALHATRGAVIGLLRLDPRRNEASYVGVGNIGVQAYSRHSIKPISKNGILGFRLPTLLEMHYTYEPGDLFILYSDGISARFALDGQIDIRQPPQCIADQILAIYGKQIDDATVVVIKTAPV
jgi:negative regulator of sigma-B (phosphoserine phosphatase)